MPNLSDHDLNEVREQRATTTLDDRGKCNQFATIKLNKSIKVN